MKQKNTSGTPRHIERQEGRYAAGIQALVKSLRLAFAGMVLVIVCMLIYFVALGSAFEVKPQEAVVVLRFGKFLKTYDQGWHWFLPYPITSFVKIPNTPSRMRVEFLPSSSSATEGGVVEYQPGRDIYMLTADTNIIHSAWTLVYRVSDAQLYYENCMVYDETPVGKDFVEYGENNRRLGGRGVETLLTNLLRNAVIRASAEIPAYDILFSQTQEFRALTDSYFQQYLADLNLGLDVQIALERQTPPPSLNEGFAAVQSAINSSGTAVEQAQTMAIDLVSSAKSEATGILVEARSYKQQIVASVQADSKYFENIREACQKNDRTAVLSALYADTMSKAFSRLDDKFVLGGNAQDKSVTLLFNPEPRRSEANSENSGAPTGGIR